MLLNFLLDLGKVFEQRSDLLVFLDKLTLQLRNLQTEVLYHLGNVHLQLGDLLVVVFIQLELLFVIILQCLVVLVAWLGRLRLVHDLLKLLMETVDLLLVTLLQSYEFVVGLLLYFLQFELV